MHIYSIMPLAVEHVEEICLDVNQTLYPVQPMILIIK